MAASRRHRPRHRGHGRVRHAGMDKPDPSALGCCTTTRRPRPTRTTRSHAAGLPGRRHFAGPACYRYEDFETARYSTGSGRGSSAAVIQAASELRVRQPTEIGKRQETAATPTWPTSARRPGRRTAAPASSRAMTVAAALKASQQEIDRASEVETSRLRMMRHYAEHPGLPAGSCSPLLAGYARHLRRLRQRPRRRPARRIPGPGRRRGRGRAADHRGRCPFAVATRVLSERWARAPSGARRRTGHDPVRRDGYRELYLPYVREHRLLEGGGLVPGLRNSPLCDVRPPPRTVGPAIKSLSRQERQRA